MSTIPRMVRQITIRPPIAPPTTAPRLIEEGEEEEEAEVREDDEGVGPDGEVVIKEYTVELELDVGIEDVSTTEPVERKAGLLKELLVTEVELDDVAVVSATVGIGRSLSV